MTQNYTSIRFFNPAAFIHCTRFYLALYIHHIKGSFRPVLVLLLALAVTAIVAPIAVKFFGRPAFGLLSITPFVGFAWVLGKLLNGDFSSGKALTAHYGWMSSTHLDLTFRLDSFPPCSA